MVQVTELAEEIKSLQDQKVIKSPVKTLNPFLDEKDILRVGGRLTHATINYDSKHQILLPKNHKHTKLIFIHYHLKNFHAGPQALLHFDRRRFWPIGGKDLARKTVHECLICFRHKPIISDQLMADLPPESVNPNLTFDNTGIDFAG
ncbi:uncharacterized protein LOC118189046 [Stegodyphus dumicola]|uniref:uncharacterized protein LOC118189046 n=1 Tax=Stegodyphus dumicola TaxID=202533 RepID=UPI0015ABBC59|nr:uncharacterized protein LOC118189046 [Stegodyphus dumicola]